MSRPIQRKLRKKHLKVVPLTDDQAKRLAQEIYCTMAVVNMREIAERVRRPVEMVNEWKQSGGWLDIRAAVFKDEFEKLVKQIERSNQSAVRLIQVGCKLRDCIEQVSEGKLAPAEVKTLAEALGKVQEVHEKAYGKLGPSV